MEINLDNIIQSKISRIVAVEPNPKKGAEIFIRKKDNTIEKKEIEFHPFLLVTDINLLRKSNIECETEELNGNAPFKFCAKYENRQDYEKIVDFLKKTTGYTPSAFNAPYRIFSDITEQVLIQANLRLFRGMVFNEARRLQLDIEVKTTEGYEFPNPDREKDEIIIISFHDNSGWEKLIYQDAHTDEKTLLKQFVEIIRERDPDIIEGHNLFNFDLPFIQKRAKRHGIRLALGRDNSEIKSRNSRLAAAERMIQYTRFDIYGRHIVDTYQLTIFYDIIHRDLEDYGLKSVASHFGVSADERTYIDASRISELWNSRKENVLHYALDDVRETNSIAEILAPSFFYQAQLIPLSYQNCIVRGNAAKIEALLISEYLNRKTALPYKEKGRPFAGGLTKALRSGVFKNVWHCDIRSLYPSIILADKLSPSKDSLGLFTELLDKLRTFRLLAKDAEKQETNPHKKDFYNALQTSFKILINSFYGYLGFDQATFNDFSLAEKVTARGREILTRMLEFLNSINANVIEMDTDGIYFQPPSEITSPNEIERKIQEILPTGIDVELDAVYKSMFCYKSKNYALLTETGEILVTGAALKSRGLEPFQRKYMKTVITYLLNEQYNEIETYTEKLKQQIINHELPLKEFAKTETLSQSVENYEKKLNTGKGRRSAAYELAIKAKRPYKQGDQISFYITGNKKRVPVVDNSRLISENSENIRDENVPYYLEKLEELHKRFLPFIPANPNKNKVEDKDKTPCLF